MCNKEQGFYQTTINWIKCSERMPPDEETEIDNTYGPKLRSDFVKINKVQIHQERVTVNLSQEEVTELILNHISDKSNFRISKDTLKKVLFTKEDCGTEGFKTIVKIELINEILPMPEGSNNPLPVEY